MTSAQSSANGWSQVFDLVRMEASWEMIPESEQGAMQIVGARDLEMEIGGSPGCSVQTFYCRLGKRAFDAVAAALGLVAASPLLLACAVAIRVDSSGPIFFRQRRVGQRGRPFNIIKFRTMAHRSEKYGLRITAGGDPRITSSGKWLRKLKLDELPQLLNVLKGDMSLVGPRAEVPEYLIHYDSDQLKVLEVKPGITGLAALTFIDEERILAGHPDKETFYIHTLIPLKLELDLSYCQRVTFLNDLRLILSTLRKLSNLGSLSSNTSIISRHTISFDK